MHSHLAQALPVDGSGSGDLRTVCDYVHLNPARAKLIKAGTPLENFRWSSYGQYLKSPSQRPCCCEWTGCLAKGASPGIRPLAAGNSRRRWSAVAPKKGPPITARFDEGGAWAAKNFAKN